MSRVNATIEKTAKQIDERMASGAVTMEQITKLHKSLDMALDEYVAFQELKSLASVSNKLTLDEAQTVYGYLGNSPEHFNTQPIYVKVVLTKIYSELLTWKMSLRAA
jgi:hypothetical protein